VFIAATNHDRKMRAFDKTTGKLLWETVLPSSGNATPAVYEARGRQFVVIAAGGGKSPQGGPGGVYVAYALPPAVSAQASIPSLDGPLARLLERIRRGGADCDDFDVDAAARPSRRDPRRRRRL
jgi:hypothetical protein